MCKKRNILILFCLVIFITLTGCDQVSVTSWVEPIEGTTQAEPTPSTEAKQAAESEEAAAPQASQTVTPKPAEQPTATQIPQENQQGSDEGKEEPSGVLEPRVWPDSMPTEVPVFDYGYFFNRSEAEGSITLLYMDVTYENYTAYKQAAIEKNWTVVEDTVEPSGGYLLRLKGTAGSLTLRINQEGYAELRFEAS